MVVKRHGGVGVGAESVGVGKEDVVGDEGLHELCIDDCVENFADEGEEGDGAEVDGEVVL